MKRYDLVVIGGGVAGETAARYAAKIGAKVALVEKGPEALGGTYLHSGCVPSQVLFPASYEGKANWTKVRRQIAQTVQQVANEKNRDNIAWAGIDIVWGTAQLLSPDGNIRVGKKELAAKKIIIATGSRPYVPSIPGLKKVGFETNETLFLLTKLPKRLAIIGGGPQAIEMASAFCRLGSIVTVVEHDAHILCAIDRDAACLIENRLVQRGVEVMVSTSIIKVDASKRQKLLELRYAGDKKQLKVDAILLAAGRRPHYPSGWDAAKIRCGENGIHVDSQWRTSNKRMYAIGDVADVPYRLSHAAVDAATQAARHAVLGVPTKNHAYAQPLALFTDPEVAQVGVTEHSLSRDGIEYKAYSAPLSAVDYAESDSTSGLVKLVVTPRGQLLGAVIVGSKAGDLIGYVAAAVCKRQSLATLSEMLVPSSTLSGALRRAIIEASFDINQSHPRPFEILRALRSFL